MHSLESLTVRKGTGKSAFVSDGSLVPPVAIQTAAWLIPVGDDLYMWINGPNGGETTQLRISSDRQIEQLPMLDVLTGGVCYCQQQFVLTGTASTGLPVVFKVDTAGNELWRYTLNDAAAATLWPAPYCIGKPAIVWQTEPRTLQIAKVDDSGIAAPYSIQVGMPPLKLTSNDQVIYTLWADNSGILGVEIGADDPHSIRIPMRYPDNLAAAPAPDGLYVAWQEGKSVYFSKIRENGKSPQSPSQIDLGEIVNGKLAIVSGTEPLLWAQQNTYDNQEETQWVSALARVSSTPLIIKGFVHNVVWWGEAIVVVGSLEMLFFKRA